MKLPQKSIELTNHQCEIHCIKYSSDGMYVMTASSNKIRLFNVQTGEIIKIYQEHGKAVLGIAIPQNTSDNSRYASCSADRSVFLWDVVTGKVLRRYQEHTARVNALDFNRDATLIASASYDSLVMLWDCRAESRKPIQILNNAKDSVESLVINGTEIICGSTDGVIRSYDVRTGRLVEDKVGCKLVSYSSNNILMSY
jgi:mitogen-activated protein kinase organizer 1